MWRLLFVVHCAHVVLWQQLKLDSNVDVLVWFRNIDWSLDGNKASGKYDVGWQLDSKLLGPKDFWFPFPKYPLGHPCMVNLDEFSQLKSRVSCLKQTRPVHLRLQHGCWLMGGIFQAKNTVSQWGHRSPKGNYPRCNTNCVTFHRTARRIATTTMAFEDFRSHRGDLHRFRILYLHQEEFQQCCLVATETGPWAAKFGDLFCLGWCGGFQCQADTGAV